MDVAILEKLNTQNGCNPVVARLCGIGGGGKTSHRAGFSPFKLLKLFKLGASLVNLLLQWKIENGKWKIVFIFPCGVRSKSQDKTHLASKIFNNFKSAPHPALPFTTGGARWKSNSKYHLPPRGGTAPYLASTIQVWKESVIND